MVDVPTQPEIDLRSDTMTRPTAEMREAMADAEVGNSALGEDPTVAQLETQAAQLLGKEAALFYPSGTMANLAAAIAWTQDVERPEILCEATCHMILYESAGLARVAGALTRPIEGKDGRMDPDRVRAHMRPEDAVETIQPTTALLCVEQTHNQAGGRALAVDHLEDLSRIASEHDVPVHMDGARLFNAAAALDELPHRVAGPGDSVMLALTKGLSAPVGSLLAGPSSFIDRAERARGLLGGAMRQAGHLAAAGQIALEQGPSWLQDDHENAQRLARGLSAIDGLGVEPSDVDTNIVFFDVSDLGVDAPTFAQAMTEEGVAYDGGMTRHKVRAVTYRGIEAEHVDEAVERTARVVDALRG